MCKEKLFRYLIVAAAVIAFALCALPLVSADSGETERYTIVVHGYNLIEFSALGVVSLLAPLIVPALLFGHQRKAVQELSLVVLFVGSMVCYVHSLRAANEWLSVASDSLHTIHPGVLLMPLGFAVEVLFTLYFALRSEKII